MKPNLFSAEISSPSNWYQEKLLQLALAISKKNDRIAKGIISVGAVANKVKPFRPKSFLHIGSFVTFIG